MGIVTQGWPDRSGKRQVTLMLAKSPAGPGEHRG